MLPDQEKLNKIASHCYKFWAEILIQEPPSRPNSLMNDHKIIVEKLNELKNILSSNREKDNLEIINREDNLTTFKKWCKDEQIFFDKVDIIKIDDNNYGLVSTEDVMDKQVLIKVPRKAIFSIDTIHENPIYKKIIVNDILLSNMNNVALVFFMCIERLNKDSKWQDYFNILPTKFTTPVNYTIEELELLKNTVIYEESLKTFRHFARQYIYFLQKLYDESSKDYSKLSIRLEDFTFDLFLWAANNVTTRINHIPSENDQKSIPCLIPLLDFSNHSDDSKNIVDFSIEDNCAETIAGNALKKGNNITIVYGNRNNYSLFLANGFCLQIPGINDVFKLKLSFPSTFIESDFRVRIYRKTTDIFTCTHDDLIPENLPLFLKLLVSGLPQDINSEDTGKKAKKYLFDRLNLLMKATYSKVGDDLPKDMPFTLKQIHLYLASEKRIVSKMLEKLRNMETL
ncbi:Histone-lysine N-methyltransferase setd3 [Strongyloides ratti]|uniref:protein-histidine N-methyltransferase n=1 Tax=Strongyloides ratti TaxID=34506 RepID=A0A090MYY5_STRRB|nr:Histone-lysine N-methyltransferase setd3 [Strongyloides ratti]CEF67994.1 Histone-lysine N-methyltransferase setd3 [Strongyloides ratti]